MGTEKRQLVFGVDTIEDAMRSYEPNPMVRLHGLDHRGRTCQSCKHLISYGYTRRFYKCDLRQNTQGPATDHRLRWRACGKVEHV